MARGIEHRNPDTLITSFGFFNKTKWAIYTGNEQVFCYEGDNTDESQKLLEDTLAAIQQSGTNTVYSLRVYNDDIRDISSKAPYKGSTTFMFGGAPVKNENGVLVIDRDTSRAQYMSNRPDPTLNERLQQLEQELASEREKRHKAELDNLRTEMDNKISGLSSSKNVDPVWVGMVSQALEKPEAIEKVFNGLGMIFDKFLNKQQPAAHEPSINGSEHADTKNSSMPNQEEEEEEEEDELSEEQEKEIQQLENRLDDALDKIENKIGTVPMVEALEKLADIPADKLQSLLAMF